MAKAPVVNVEEYKGKALPTHYRFYVFFRSGNATFRLKSGSGTEREGESFVMLPKEIIDLACKQSSRITRLFGEFFTLIQRLSRACVNTERRRVNDKNLHVHESNVLRDFCPELRNERDES